MIVSVRKTLTTSNGAVRFGLERTRSACRFTSTLNRLKRSYPQKTTRRIPDVPPTNSRRESDPAVADRRRNNTTKTDGQRRKKRAAARTRDANAHGV